MAYDNAVLLVIRKRRLSAIRDCWQMEHLEYYYFVENV